jgi:hypothetical protein
VYQVKVCTFKTRNEVEFMRNIHVVILAAALLLVGNLTTGQEAPKTSQAEEIRVGSWNVEMFMKMFDQDRMPLRAQDQTELFRDEEDQYEVATVLKNPTFAPDIMLIEECCDEDMLNLFNKKWLPGVYSFIKVFPGNTDGQYLGVLAKAGFQPQQTKDQYYLEKDTVQDRRPTDNELSAPEGENRLFSRGP